MEKEQEKFKKPRDFLASKKLIFLAIGLLIIINGVSIFLFKESIGAYIKQISDLVIKTTFEFELLYPVMLVIVLFTLLFLSYYVLRSAHQKTGNPIAPKKLFSKGAYETWKQLVSNGAYYLSNVYVAGLEVIMYGLIFSIGFTYTLPGSREQDASAIEFLLMPAIWGIIIMICFYVVLSTLLWWVFSSEYGGFLTVEELKWNRVMIDLVSTLLFIFAILGTIITVVIDKYKFTPVESKWLFTAAIFTIVLYVLKVIKNFIITFVETKILK